MRIKKKLALLLSAAMLVTSVNVTPLTAFAADNPNGTAETPATGSTKLTLDLSANKGYEGRAASGSTKLTLVIADHEWEYFVGTGVDANKLTAKCSLSDHSSDDCHTKGVSLTLSATSVNYSGSTTGWCEADKVAFELVGKDAWESAVGTAPTIQYTRTTIDGTAYTREDKPTVGGSYTAYIECDEKKAELSFLVGHVFEGQPYVDVEDGIHHNQKCKYCDNVSQGNHDFSKYISNEDGTHKMVCTDCDAAWEGHDKDACTFDSGVVITQPTTTSTGVKTYTCTACGYTKTETIDKLTPEHVHSYSAAWKNDATNHWKECECGDKTANVAHTFDAGKVTKEATESAEGVKTYTCTVCGQTKTEAIPKKEATKPDDKKPDDQEPEAPKKGDSLKDDKTGALVKIIDSDKKEVVFVAPKDAKATTITVPATITVNGVTYKVTKINDGAFKGNKTVTKIVLPSSIVSIGKDAFNGCKKLKTITIPKNVTEIGANAFKGCVALTKITIPSKVVKIGANAFNGCKKLKTITVKTKKLTTKTVGKNAFKGVPKKATMKVPKKQLKAYKKFMSKKGFKGKAKK